MFFFTDLNMFCASLAITSHKLVSNKLRTCFTSFYLASNEGTYKKKDKSKSCVSLIITNNIFVACNFELFDELTYGHTYCCGVNFGEPPNLDSATQPRLCHPT